MSDGSVRAQAGSRRPGTHGASALVIASVALAPLAYVLSIGPVVAIADKTGRGLAAVEVFYAPVIWLHDHTALKEPLEWYADIWGWK